MVSERRAALCALQAGGFDAAVALVEDVVLASDHKIQRPNVAKSAVQTYEIVVVDKICDDAQRICEMQVRFVKRDMDDRTCGHLDVVTASERRHGDHTVAHGADERARKRMVELILSL